MTTAFRTLKYNNEVPATTLDWIIHLRHNNIQAIPLYNGKDTVINPIGDQFQQETKYHRESLPRNPLDWSSQPQLYKSYPNSNRIELPEVTVLSDMSVFEALRKRKSVRNYSAKPITKEALAFLLWASTGISRNEGGYPFRTAPSAGALYPIETYPVVNAVSDISPGVYHYNIRNHCLELLKEGDFGIQAANATLGQEMCAAAAVVFIWTAVFERMKWKYGQRAYRYVYLDAGHIAENLALAAVSAGLKTCQIGALFDDEVNHIIDVDGSTESVIYMSVVG